MRPRDFAFKPDLWREWAETGENVYFGTDKSGKGGEGEGEKDGRGIFIKNVGKA